MLCSVLGRRMGIVCAVYSDAAHPSAESMHNDRAAVMIKPRTSLNSNKTGNSVKVRIVATVRKLVLQQDPSRLCTVALGCIHLFQAIVKRVGLGPSTLSFAADVQPRKSITLLLCLLAY